METDSVFAPQLLTNGDSNSREIVDPPGKNVVYIPEKYQFSMCDRLLFPH